MTSCLQSDHLHVLIWLLILTTAFCYVSSHFLVPFDLLLPCLFLFCSKASANRLIWSDVNQTPSDSFLPWYMWPQSSGDNMPVPSDAKGCLAVINDPAWWSRQFGSIRNWNALRLIRQTQPKYPLLVMRALCHSLTPPPVWPRKEGAQGEHLHFFLPAEMVSFDEVERMKGRMREQVDCWLHRDWWLCETMVYGKGI